MSENRSPSDMVDTSSARELLELCISAGVLSASSSRQCRRNELAKASKIFKGSTIEREAGMRALGWTSEEEKQAERERRQRSYDRFLRSGGLGMLGARLLWASVRR